MTTMEDVFYDFTEYEENRDKIINKNKMGSFAPKPVKPEPIPCNIQQLAEYDKYIYPFFGEEEKDGSALENDYELLEDGNETASSTTEEYVSKTSFDVVSDKIKKKIENFHVKFYIRPLQECSICLEPILTKSTAFLTPCGHGFHRKCIHTATKLKWLSRNCDVPCPLCRNYNIYEYNVDKYCIWNKKINEMDKLENFWETFEMQLAQPCSSDGTHYIGLKKDCERCVKYRKGKR